MEIHTDLTHYQANNARNGDKPRMEGTDAFMVQQNAQQHHHSKPDGQVKGHVSGVRINRLSSAKRDSSRIRHDAERAFG